MKSMTDNAVKKIDTSKTKGEKKDRNTLANPSVVDDKLDTTQALIHSYKRREQHLLNQLMDLKNQVW